MSTPQDAPIPAGRRYVALCDLQMEVHDYEALGVRHEVLRAASVFQPWEPEAHWRGQRVPITLGGEAAQFDWGVTSAEGHFLAWNDFFEQCAPEAEVAGAGSATLMQEPPPHFYSSRDLFLQDHRGRTVLFYAAERGRNDQVEAMLRSCTGTGFSPQRLALLQVRDRDGLTAADVAERSGHRAIAERLRGEEMRMEFFE